MADNIRSEYIKNLVDKKDEMMRRLEESTSKTMQGMMEESLSRSVRKMLSEAEGGYEEEEVETDSTPAAGEEGADGGEATGAAEAGADAGSEGAAPEGDGADGAAAEGGEGDGAGAEAKTPGDEGNGGIDWSSLDQYKDEEGDYDLRGMEPDEVVKVLKVMSPEDGVRVLKNENGTITLNDDETNKEYIIDVDGNFAGGGSEPAAAAEAPEGGESADDDTTFDIDLGDEEGGEANESVQSKCGTPGLNEANTGYTDNYQSQTAMTTPTNNEPAKSSETYSMDGGVPTGTDKPFAGNGDKAPFTQKVNEGEGCPNCGKNPCECGGKEGKVEESSTTTSENSAGTRGVTMSHPNSDSSQAYARNAHVGGEQVRGTGEGYKPATNESLDAIKRKANEIFMENKQLRDTIEKLVVNLNEAVVVNYSLGRINRLMIENSTTRDEKIEIANKFKAAKTTKDCDILYEAISADLKKRPAPAQQGTSVQIAESKQGGNVVERQMYQSEELSNMLSLMERMERL